ncbi:hypothetical protein NDU88_000544 [Pleurodeles waltl]|uniref:Uncharacterized protein n=1 Tax=Pleurodeles waltl TaxID=8319 RepID=A0AAV7UTP2_PLEWA|nr:hypothetical protein NDU88_000544 [Pleurodeles waltl]
MNQRPILLLFRVQKGSSSQCVPFSGVKGRTLGWTAVTKRQARSVTGGNRRERDFVATEYQPEDLHDKSEVRSYKDLCGEETSIEVGTLRH